jgi:hypothetical protein
MPVVVAVLPAGAAGAATVVVGALVAVGVGVAVAGAVIVKDAGSVPVTCVTVWSSVVTTLLGDGTPGRVVVVSAKAVPVPVPARHSARTPAETVVR